MNIIMKKNFFKPMMLCFLCMATVTLARGEQVHRHWAWTGHSYVGTALFRSGRWDIYQRNPVGWGHTESVYVADFDLFKRGQLPPFSGTGSAESVQGGYSIAGPDTTQLWVETFWTVVNRSTIGISWDASTPVFELIVEPGDKISARHELGVGPPTTWRTMLTWNDTVVFDDGHVPFTGNTGPHVMWFAAMGQRHYPPVWEHLPNIRKMIFTDVDWIEGIRGRWGHTAENKIPSKGLIRITSLVGGTDSTLSTDGLVFDRIGTSQHNYIMQDDHSLSVLYPFDTTSTSGVRKISVFTVLSPSLRIQYAGIAQSHLVGNDYYHNLETTLACNGESGWTNQPLDITIDPDAIVGTFDTLLTLPDFTTTVTNAIATRTNYHIESSSALGTPISGVLTAVGDATNLLSGTVNGFVKIDKTNPIPAATHVSGYNFTDDSTDTLSGISLTRPSKIAFSAPSGPQPASSDFHNFDAIPTMPDGTYDIWVTATDKAGNTATERVLTDILLLNGTVELTKDTDQGATLHTSTCPDLDSIAITSCTPQCSLGANIEIEEKSTLTYKLTLTNTDTTDTAAGTFEDYLPEGTIISTMPTITPAGSAAVVFDLETTGPYTGRYKVSGTYTDLASGGQIEIDILTRAPAFDKVTAMNNIITNQASTNWTLGTGPSERTDRKSTRLNSSH